MLTMTEKALAMQEVKRLRKLVADYEEECRQAWKDGYNPHYCIHGTNLWVDWDCACWKCEAGGLDPRIPTEMYRIALDNAKEAWTEALRRNALILPLLREWSLPEEVKQGLIEWFSPWKEDS